MEERLQKIIANAGITSRRKAEELITGGRVRVNSRVVRELGARANPDTDLIEVDGALIHQPDKVYYLMHKPPQVITALEDPEGRTHLGEILRVKERVVPVGRLDYESEGLLLLTNDGDIVYKLTHPKYGVQKTYHVKVKGIPSPEQIDLLRRGVTIDDRRTGRNEVEWMRNTRGDVNSWWRVTINEGINRQIRKMFDRIEHPVQKLIRVQEGEIDLGDLPRGAVRELTRDEVQYLRSIGKGTAATERAAKTLASRRPKTVEPRGKGTRAERPSRSDTRGDRPASRGDRPAARGERPASRGDRPASRGDRPASRGDRPPARGERPASRGERPAPGGERAAGRGERSPKRTSPWQKKVVTRKPRMKKKK